MMTVSKNDSIDFNIADSSLFTKVELSKFRMSLISQKEQILKKSQQALKGGSIKLDTNEMMDEVDLASATIEQNITFNLLDRDRRLLSEIERALEKIRNGDYGFCEGTGEAIPKRRLELAPWTRHSVKYKERLESLKKTGRGVGDEDNHY